MKKPKQVFISYSSRDWERALEIRQLLESNQITCWMDKRDIRGGKDFTDEVPEAIELCKVFVLILSEDAQKSKYVKRELQTAVDKEKFVIPYGLGKKEIEITKRFKFLMEGYQRIDECEFGCEEAKRKLVQDIWEEIKKQSADKKQLTVDQRNPMNEQQRYSEADAEDTRRPDTKRSEKRNEGKQIKCRYCRNTGWVESVSIRDYLIENLMLEDVLKIICITAIALGSAIVYGLIRYGQKNGYGLGIVIMTTLSALLAVGGVLVVLFEKSIRKSFMRLLGYKFDKKNSDVLYNRIYVYRCDNCGRRLRTKVIPANTSKPEEPETTARVLMRLKEIMDAMSGPRKNKR